MVIALWTIRELRLDRISKFPIHLPPHREEARLPQKALGGSHHPDVFVLHHPFSVHLARFHHRLRELWNIARPYLCFQSALEPENFGFGGQFSEFSTRRCGDGRFLIISCIADSEDCIYYRSGGAGLCGGVRGS